MNAEECCNWTLWQFWHMRLFASNCRNYVWTYVTNDKAVRTNFRFLPTLVRRETKKVVWFFLFLETSCQPLNTLSLPGSYVKRNADYTLINAFGELVSGKKLIKLWNWLNWWVLQKFNLGNELIEAQITEIWKLNFRAIVILKFGFCKYILRIFFIIF